MIRVCSPDDADAICEVINASARALRAALPRGWLKNPYVTRAGVKADFDLGMTFWGSYERQELVAVMGLQTVKDLAIIRHAFTHPEHRRQGNGQALLERLRHRTGRRLIAAAWSAARDAVRFYERRGFQPLPEEQAAELLGKHWKLPQEQLAELVLFGDESGARAGR